MSQLIVRPALAHEMNEIYALRYRIFCQELKFFDPALFPGGLERDEYDDRSHHIIMLRDQKIVAYFRLILPRGEERFPIELAAVELPRIFQRKEVVEISRGLIVPEERRGEAKDKGIEAAFDYCRQNGIKYILSFSNKIMYDNFRKRGTRFLYEGIPVMHHGFETWPLIISVSQ